MSSLVCKNFYCYLIKKKPIIIAIATAMLSKLKVQNSEEKIPC